MIRALSLSAALALLPLSAALAQETPQTAAEAALEAASEAFEARMESFGGRAEAIGDDESLSEEERDSRIAALWAEYQPEVTAFTTLAAEQAGAIAQQALANIDVDALVENALNDVDIQGAMAAAGGVAHNGAWGQDDPEQRITYGLMAQYAIDQAMDAVGDAEEDAEEDAGIEPEPEA